MIGFAVAFAVWMGGVARADVASPCGCGGKGGIDYRDDDGDGFLYPGGDCDDEDPAVNPDATEDPTNGIDDDCDGLVDEDPDDTDDTGGDQAAFRERGFGPVVPAALVFTGLGLGVAARRRRQRSDA